MTILRHTNNFSTTLASGINSSVTSMTLTSGTGLPTLSGSDEFYLTLEEGSAIEIVRVTARTGASITTMVRAQQGTTAAAFTTAAVVELRPTADGFDRKADGAASSTDNAIARFDGTSGKELQNSGVIISDTNVITGLDTLTCNGTGALTVPAGTTGQRPSAVNGMIRYNSTFARYEGAAGASFSGTQFLIDGDFSGTGVMTRTGANAYSTFALGTGVQTFLTTPSSANLRTAVTDETGTGSLVFATSPTLVTPVLGAAAATSINFGQDSLNYYDEGTFSPTFTFDTVGNLTVSYAIQSGAYTRIGNFVFFTLTLRWTPTFTTASGNATLGGLPFTVNASYDFVAFVTWASAGVPTYPSTGTHIFGQLAGSGLTIRAGKSAAVPAVFGASDITTGVQRTIFASGVYVV